MGGRVFSDSTVATHPSLPPRGLAEGGHQEGAERKRLAVMSMVCVGGQFGMGESAK